MEKDINKRKVLKGTRYLLLRNGADIFDKEYKARLDNALDMNKPLSKAYYLKEQLREIWMQPNKQATEKVMLDWVKQAQESKVTNPRADSGDSSHRKPARACSVGQRSFAPMHRAKPAKIAL